MSDDPITKRLLDGLPASEPSGDARAGAAWRAGRRRRLVRRRVPQAFAAIVVVVVAAIAVLGGPPNEHVVVADHPTTTDAPRSTTTTAEATTTTAVAPSAGVTTVPVMAATTTTGVRRPARATTTTRPRATDLVLPAPTTALDSTPRVVDRFTAKCPAAVGVHAPPVDPAITMPLLAPFLARANPTGLPVLTCRTDYEGFEMAQSEIDALAALGVQVVTELPEVRYSSKPSGLQCDRRLWCYETPIVWLDYWAKYYPGTSPISSLSMTVEADGCTFFRSWRDVVTSTAPNGGVDSCPDDNPRGRTFGEPD